MFKIASDISLICNLIAGLMVALTIHMQIKQITLSNKHINIFMMSLLISVIAAVGSSLVVRFWEVLWISQ